MRSIIKSFLVASIILSAGLVHAQAIYATVTGTVTDPSGNPLAGAQYVFTLVDSVGNPVAGAKTPNGSITNAKTILSQLDANGFFSVSLLENNTLSSPAGTQWKMRISAPPLETQAYILDYQPAWTINYTTTITGPTDLSSQISGMSQPIYFMNLKTGQNTLTPVHGIVTSVTGTAPLSFTTGSTPVGSMTQASSTVDGWLSHTDWNTFNGKQAALGFTPYNATNPAGYITSSITTLPSLTLPYSQLSGTPSLGTWSALNYPTWTSGTPFVKMTAAGTFVLDTNTYLTSSAIASTTNLLVGNGSGGASSSGIAASTVVVTDPTGPQTTGSQPFNGVYYPLYYTGGDLCVQMKAAIDAMPAAGGILDISGLSLATPASCSINPFIDINYPVVKPISVLLGIGRINTTAQWYINAHGFKLQGQGGFSQLVYTGTTDLLDPSGNAGGVFELDCPSPTTCNALSGSGNVNDTISNLAIVGNAHSPYAMLIDGTHKSSFSNLTLWGAASCDYKSGFMVTNLLTGIHSSIFSSEAFSLPGAAPPNGFCFDGNDALYQTTDSTVTDIISEGHSVCGIELSNAGGMIFIGGTSEQNGTSGNASSANLCNSGKSNTFIDLDMEAAGNSKDVLDSGLGTTYINILSADGSTLSGRNITVQGGQWEYPVVTSTAVNTKFSQVLTGTGITDNGIGTSIDDIYPENTSQFQTSAGLFEGIPWTWRKSTNTYVQSGIGNPDSEDWLQTNTEFNNTTPTVLSTTILTTSSPWRAIFTGQWTNSYNGGGLPQPPTLYIVSSTHPTVTAGSVTVTFSVNSSGYFQGIVTGSSYLVGFAGSVQVVSANINSAGTIDAQFNDGISVGGGLNVAGAATLGAGSTVDGSPICTTATGCGTTVSLYRYSGSLGTGTLAAGACGTTNGSVYSTPPTNPVVSASFSAGDISGDANIILTPSWRTDTNTPSVAFCNNSGTTWTYTGYSINMIVQ